MARAENFLLLSALLDMTFIKAGSRPYYGFSSRPHNDGSSGWNKGTTRTWNVEGCELVVNCNSANPLVSQNFDSVPHAVVQAMLDSSMSHSSGPQVQVKVQVSVQEFQSEEVTLKRDFNP